MASIVGIFNQILYFPLLNVLILIYNFLPFKDLGVAIIILTVLIRFLLYPLSRKSIQSQQAINKLQPEIKEIQKRYKKKKTRRGKRCFCTRSTKSILSPGVCRF